MDGFIFDMDGVLLDTERLYLECWMDISKEFNIDKNIMKDIVYKCIGLSSKETEQLFESSPSINYSFSELNDKVIKRYREIQIQNGIPVKPGVYMILEYLKRNKIPIGLASSTKYNSVINKLEEAKIINYFKVIIGGDMVQKGKPSPDIYLKACKELKFNPAKTVAIEDSENGLKSAKSAGLVTIMVPDLIPYSDNLKPYVNEKFNTLTDILELLRKGEFIKTLF